ncbi:MAG: alginate export family protein [Nitrospiria bacterium]
MQRILGSALRFLIVVIFSGFCFKATQAHAAGTTSVSKTKKAALADAIIDTEASPPLRQKVTPRFSWGSKLNVATRLRNNRDLRDGKEDRDNRTKGSLSIAGLYLSAARMMQPKWEVFSEIKVQREVSQKEGEGRTKDETEFSFRKGYIIVRRFLDPSMRLQVGRQKFKDFREWVYDENMDAVRLFYEKDRLELQLSYSTNLFDPEDPEDEIKNLILYGIYRVWAKDKVAAYVVNRRGDDSDLGPDSTHVSLTFVGVSLKGKSINKQKYWLEAATVFGGEAGKKVRGYGFDIGWTTRFRHPLKPAFSVGYAFGSGDSNPDDNRDKSFRQTGLQDNSAKLRGKIKVEQYGEIFEPELSNLMVGTLGFGIRLADNQGSLDIVYHRFRQVWALQERDNELRDVGVKPDPNGDSRDLGDEIDLAFRWKVSSELNLNVITGVFLPGSAFSEKDDAFLAKIAMQFLL